MLDPNKILVIPREEKLYIKPEVRQALFSEIIAEYPKRYPNLKLIYANLNTNPEYPLDYVIIFKTNSIQGNIPLIVYDAPLLYSDRTTPGYRYCRRMHKEDDFYLEGVKSMTTLPEARFNEYIENMILIENVINNKLEISHLSLSSKSPLFWKSATYSGQLMKGLIDLALRYVKKS